MPAAVSSYLAEFLALAGVHALAVASPGPDFAIVLRQSLRHGRRTAVWTGAGIGCGISVHVTYTLLGFGLVLQRHPAALAAVQYAGAAYLAWVGVQAIRARPRKGDVDLTASEGVPGAGRAWLTGFLINVLNPKAALFFIALFPLAVSATTPRPVQAVYGVWLCVATFAWFAFVALVFAQEAPRRAFLRHGHWIDRALGVVFLGFAVSLAVSRLR